MLDIFFLGTGGAVATETRDNTALLLQSHEDLVLVDCPGSVTRKIKSVGLDPRQVHAVLITHVHPDHIYGLPSFVHNLMLDDLSIRLYGSEIAIQTCQKLLDLFNLQKDSIRCRIEFVSLASGDHFEAAPGVECQALHVPHHESSLAFLWRSPLLNKRVLYSGDTPLHPPFFELAAGTDTLIHDCSVPSRYFLEYPFMPRMHTNALELGRMAQQAEVKRLIPCHFFGELAYDISEISAEIRQHYSGELIIPQDLMRVACEE
jgi:ribonuclease Z